MRAIQLAIKKESKFNMVPKNAKKAKKAKTLSPRAKALEHFWQA